MKFLRSIRWRLQAWHGLLLAVILGGLGVTAYRSERAHLREQMDQRLQSLAGRLANAARPRPGPQGERPSRDGARELRLSAPDAAAFLPGGGYYYAVWLKNGPPFTVSANAPDDVPRPPEDESGLRSRGVLREAYFSPAPGDISLVGASGEVLDARLRRLAWTLTGGGLSIFAAAMLVGAWFVHRSLRPLRDIIATAAQITGGDLSRRIETRDPGSEFCELAQVLNATFARLEAAFARQVRFTADAAHELRTPVTVILTHAQNALADGGLSSRQREAVEACERAAQRMRRLIEGLLQLARLDAGRDPAPQDTVDLALVAAEAVDHLHPLAAGRDVTLTASLSTAAVRGDACALGRVVTNLVGNAIHHGREGGRVLVAVGTKSGEAFLEVTDDGPGIPPEHEPFIFERFYRVDKARTGASGRTGLGLAITRALVEAHGGTITVRSGPGATFTVRLPCA